MAWNWTLRTVGPPAVFTGDDGAGSTGIATEKAVADAALSRWGVKITVTGQTRPWDFDTGWLAGVTEQDRFDAVEPTVSAFADDIVAGKVHR